MQTIAVVMSAPLHLGLAEVGLAEPGEADVVVDVTWSGISTGTERLLWTGRMPQFPGLGYPLVPGYESVGRIVAAGRRACHGVGTTVFVPGSSGFTTAKGLFGGAARRVVVPAERVAAVTPALGERAVLLALAATAHHAIAMAGARGPDLIVGHGVLGRLMARLQLYSGGVAPVVWEANPKRRDGATGYPVLDPADDPRRDYRTIIDVSGDSGILDTLVARLAPGGEIVLAGFYDAPLSFSFPPAFMREARFRIAAEWKRPDLVAVQRLVEAGALSLDGLITHRAAASDAERAYRTAFDDPGCLKMVLDWSGAA